MVYLCMQTINKTIATGRKGVGKGRVKGGEREEVREGGVKEGRVGKEG